MTSNIRTERFPTTWCAGCMLNALLLQTANIMKKLGMDKTNSTAVSGIGCTARATGYLNLDSVNGLHGRAIPIAEGIKLATPETNVLVFSGDGDLTGIGGNHLLHAARRNTDLTVICAVNEIYGMTGGQMSPLTKKGTKTLTSPAGAEYQPLNVKGIITSNQKYFFARTTTAHLKHMMQVIEEALKHKGFAFIEVLTPCHTNAGRRIGYNSFKEMLDGFKESYKIIENAKVLQENELGVMTK